MKRKKISAGITILLCLSLLSGVFAGCSSNSSSAARTVAEKPGAVQTPKTDIAGGTATDKTAFGEAAPADGNAETSTTAAAASLSTQKIIERLNYNIETMSFDNSVSRLQSLCTEFGGYVQDSNITGKNPQVPDLLRQADFTLRIPQEKLSQLKSRVGEIGTTINSSSSSENISERYYDTEARLKSLRTEQERLLALLQKSGTLADIVALEKALADVNYQIEQLTSTLRGYDSLIDFSTVSIHLDEVLKPTEIESTPVTLGDRIVRQFQNSMRGLGSFGEALLVFFLGGAPIILLLLLIASVLYWVLIRRKRRAEKRKASQIVPVEDETPDPDDESIKK